MLWWKGKLYVGTGRATFCLHAWGYHELYPLLFRYPPPDPRMQCTENPRDLPLQAEIWRYTPETATWERVFQSPNNARSLRYPRTLTARDAGFRNLIAFTEPDGTEALYALGITSELIFPNIGPPRLLRTTDGAHWAPVPQDRGTVLGDLGQGQANLRAAEVYKGRLYMVAGDLLGAGRLLESADKDGNPTNPKDGNNSFRFVTPPEMEVYELATYHGYLYLGLKTDEGYAVVKTDATGTPPYTFTTVVDKGGYAGVLLPPGDFLSNTLGPDAAAIVDTWASFNLTDLLNLATLLGGDSAPSPDLFVSASVVSMYVYKDSLYAGTHKPAQLLRINPDDSWDVIVGKPRETPAGWKVPLSGLGSGFDYGSTNHIHRMGEHQGKLYVSTNDGTGILWDMVVGEEPPFVNAFLGLNLRGFDLYVTEDGEQFTLLTLTGFDHPFDNVMRVFASSPFGLFGGTINGWEQGLRVYVGNAAPAALAAPADLTLEGSGRKPKLSWQPVPQKQLYRVFRTEVLDNDPAFRELGTTPEPFFEDKTVKILRVYHYYVVAEDAAGSRSAPSNLVRWPSLLTPPPTTP